MEKTRLDMLLMSLKLVDSRSLAQRMIMAGEVTVDGQLALKPSDKVPVDAVIELLKQPTYVSRGGEKLEAALIAFNKQVLTGMVCVDVGSSTGGFTDCLLQHGATRVYAVDVGYGILHWKMRNHPGVVVMERTNARYVDSFPEKIHLVTIDASFISLRILLPVISGWFSEDGGEIIALIKPQFEAGEKDAARGRGVIRSPEIHRKVLAEVLSFAEQKGYGVAGLIRSPLVGQKGNIEFLVHLNFPAKNDVDWGIWVERELVEKG